MPKKKSKEDKVFAAELVKRRNELGWTLAQMAEYLGVSTRGVLKYERGESCPPEVMKEGIRWRLDKLKYAPGSDRETKSEPRNARKRK